MPGAGSTPGATSTSTTPTPAPSGRSAGIPQRTKLIAGIGALALVLLGVIVAWQLAGGDDDSSTAADTTVAVVGTEFPPDDTAAPTETTTAATTPETTPETTVVETTVPTTTPGVPAPPLPPTAVLVTDPAGWTMQLDQTWTERNVDGRRSWITGSGSATFEDNINVSTEAIPGPLSVDDYANAAIANVQLSAPDFALESQKVFVGPDNVRIVVIVWTGTLSGLPKLAFQQSMVIGASTAYVATFSSETDRMPTLSPIVEAYLVTLRGA
ncbi:MAG: hypothetical protein ACOYL9_01460 [Ilumatobacteraceae bacterium]